MSGAGISSADARELAARACLALDEADYDAFLALCSPGFRYAIEVYSPEIRRDMTWLEHDLDGMRGLLESVHQHLLRPDRPLRHLGASIVTGSQANALQLNTSFTILHTGTDGVTRLWAAGRYHDAIVVEAGSLRLLERRVALHTRDIGIGSHVPL